MQMDRSFLAFKHFLQRIISGADAPQPARKPADPSNHPARRDPKAEIPDDWARIEF